MSEPTIEEEPGREKDWAGKKAQELLALARSGAPEHEVIKAIADALKSAHGWGWMECLGG